MMRGAVARGAARLCGMLLLLYPRSFRDEFGYEMTCDFEDATHSAWHSGGALEVLSTCARYGWDLGRNMITQWIRTGWPTLIAISASWSALLVALLALQSIPQANPLAFRLHAVWLVIAGVMALLSVALGRYHGEHAP